MRILQKPKMVGLIFVALLLAMVIACVPVEETAVDTEAPEQSGPETNSRYTITQVVPGLMKITLTGLVEIPSGVWGHGGAFDEALQELNRKYLIGTNITPIEYWVTEGSYTRELLVPVKLRE